MMMAGIIVSDYKGETGLVFHSRGKEESVCSRELPLWWVSFNIAMSRE